MSKTNFYNLSAITSRIQEILQPHSEKLFWVKAEISSGRERGGSFYCDLVETSKNGKILAKIRCSIWSQDLDRIKKNFKNHDLELKLDDGTSVSNPKCLIVCKSIGIKIFPYRKLILQNSN